MPVMEARVDDVMKGGAVAMLPIAALQPSPTNPRKGFDKARLAELADSIRARGILQPILVRPLSAGKGMEIVAGERRWKAAEAAGLEEVPAIVREMTDAEVMEAQLVENLQRDDLHPLEEAEGYRQLMAKGRDVARVAEQMGRSIAYVYDRVKLLSLTKAAQKAFHEGRFTTRHAIILARLSPSDQARVMDEETGGLWEEERALFAPDAPEEDPPRLYKPVSVKELEAWVDRHVKLEAREADPMLFPDLAAAAETHKKLMRVTYEQITPEDAKDGPRPILGRSWMRADGQRGSKECEHSITGHVVIGPDRGQVLRVCVDKKHCTVHWGDLIKAAKKREKEVAKAGATGEDREAIRRRKDEEDRAREKAESERWKKATPAILEALAAAVKKAPTGAGSFLGKLVLEAFADAMYVSAENKKHLQLVPPGRTAEDLVRHAAFADLVQACTQEWDLKDFSADAKALGVDVRKILAAAAPAAEAKTTHPKKAKAAKRKA